MSGHTQELPAKLMREGLRHMFPGVGDESFFQLIDETGGWPLGYKYVGFAHSDDREAGFTTTPVHHGWWTTVASADDYYLWKLSPEALQRIVTAAVAAIRLPAVDASRIYIKNWRGHGAAVTHKKEAA